MAVKLKKVWRWRYPSIEVVIILLEPFKDKPFHKKHHFSATSASIWQRWLFSLHHHFKNQSMMVDIYDYDIKCIESEILMQYYRYNYTEFYCLLELRKCILNRRVLAHQEDILQHIVDFNDALTEALREMYGRAHRIWNSIKENDVYGDDMELAAKCFLSSKYPELHPIQSEYREDLWSALCDSGWNHLYEDGVLLPTFTLPNDINTSFDSFIGMDCPPPNWNEN